MEGKRAVLALMLSLVVACGGAAPSTGAGAGAGASTAVGTSPASATSAAPAASAPAAATATANQPKLSDILAAGKLASYKVTYKITTTGGGTDFSGEQTWYFKPPKSRFDFSSNFGGQKTTISFFTLPDGSYYCFTVTGSVQCLSVAGVGSPLDQNAAAVAQRALIQDPSSYGATFKETKTIAGQQALCYTVTGASTAGFSGGTFCYSKEGLALLSSFSVQGASWSMEATNVSMTVPDSDFTLPATPLKAP